jgi:hypothetical protein
MFADKNAYTSLASHFYVVVSVITGLIIPQIGYSRPIRQTRTASDMPNCVTMERAIRSTCGDKSGPDILDGGLWA